MSEFNKKIRKYLPWEQFWLRTSGIGIGIVVAVYSIINLNQWGMFKSIGLFLIAVLWTVINIWSAIKNYRKM